MTGANNSTSFPDSARGGNAPHTVTAVGDAKIVTAQADPFGASNGVGYLDGTGDYWSAPDSDDWQPGAGFTFEEWIRFASFKADYNTLIGHTDTVANWWEFSYRHDTKALFLSSNAISISQSWTPATATWYHVALVKDGNDYEFFVDGTSIGSATDADAIPAINGLLYIGWNGVTAGREINAHICDAAITRRAKYTANFTPPPRLTPYL